jgi:hypothetical protein
MAITNSESWTFIDYTEWTDTVLRMYPCAAIVDVGDGRVHALVSHPGVMGQVSTVVGMHRKDGSGYVVEDDTLPLGCDS